MKYIKTKEIATRHRFTNLESDDAIDIKLPNGFFFSLSFNLMRQSLDFRLYQPADLLDKEPFLSISCMDMEYLNSKNMGEFINITFPTSLREKVKEALKDLPIIV